MVSAAASVHCVAPNCVNLRLELNEPGWKQLPSDVRAPELVVNERHVRRSGWVELVSPSLYDCLLANQLPFVPYYTPVLRPTLNLSGAALGPQYKGPASLTNKFRPVRQMTNSWSYHIIFRNQQPASWRLSGVQPQKAACPTVRRRAFLRPHVLKESLSQPIASVLLVYVWPERCANSRRSSVSGKSPSMAPWSSAS